LGEIPESQEFSPVDGVAEVSCGVSSSIGRDEGILNEALDSAPEFTFAERSNTAGSRQAALGALKKPADACGAGALVMELRETAVLDTYEEGTSANEMFSRPRASCAIKVGATTSNTRIKTIDAGR
jgi:hypothetical protein